KITPEVSGGTGNLQYKYWIWFDGKWTIVQDFSSSRSYEWTPTQAGNYKIWVDVKDSMGTMKSKEMSYVVTEAALKSRQEH
ncbi:triple tyrosine motif-containing protein, partial [Turicibacter bilis]